MENPDTPKPQGPKNPATKTSEDPLSEATSEKTVSDLERSEKVSDSNDHKTSDDRSVPSPDGTANPERSGGRADGSDTGGPM
jgi:hypothetical protein